MKEDEGPALSERLNMEVPAANGNKAALTRCGCHNVTCITP